MKPYLKNLFGTPLKELEQIEEGLYRMLSNFDPSYLHRELQFRANFWDEGIFSFRILYKNMTSYPIISIENKYFCDVITLGLYRQQT